MTGDIRERLSDSLPDSPDPLWWLARWLPLRWWWCDPRVAVCLVLGHEPECRDCDLPGDDECHWCRRPTPGKAHPTGGTCPGWVPRHEGVDR